MSIKKTNDEKVSNVPPFGLRMLPELKERVAAQAAKNGRSMNAEIVENLRLSLDGGLSEKSELIDEIERLKLASKSQETRALEQDLYWYNIALSLNRARRAHLMQFKASIRHIMSFGELIPPELREYCREILEIYSDQYDDLPRDEEAMRFLKKQAENAHNLVYAAPDGEDDPDFIIDPPKV